MPTSEENRARWTDHAWSQGGDDWSFGWGSSRMPAAHLLEIAPGHGRPRWRDARMTAELLRRFAGEAGLEPDAQELVQWGAPVANDCFSWLRRTAPGEERGRAELPTHPSFGAEIDHCGWFFRVPGRGRA